MSTYSQWGLSAKRRYISNNSSIKIFKNVFRRCFRANGWAVGKLLFNIPLLPLRLMLGAHVGAEVLTHYPACLPGEVWKVLGWEEKAGKKQYVGSKRGQLGKDTKKIRCLVSTLHFPLKNNPKIINWKKKIQIPHTKMSLQISSLTGF